MTLETLIFVFTICLSISKVLCQDDWTCKTVELMEEKQGKIFCLPRNGVPFGTKWTRNSLPLVNDNEFRIENDGLVILNVQRSHAGSYRVRWTDPDTGSESIKDATVNVIAPVKFLPTRSTVEVVEGENVTLEMKVDGLPVPNCRWYDKTGNPLRAGDNTAILGCSIQLFQVQDSEAGMFTVIATNKVGTDTGSATLSIEGKKASGTAPHSLVNVELLSVTSKSLTIHVEGPSTGEPVISTQCIYSVLHPFKLPNEKNIIWELGPARNNFTLEDLREGFVYRLHCASIGVDNLRSEWSSNLDVKLAAPAPELWVQMLTKENLRFTWDVPTDNVLYNDNQILEYQLSYKTVSRLRSQWTDASSSCPIVITIPSCGSRSWDIYQPGSRYYSAKVRARNQGGWSEWSKEITAGGASF